MQIDYELKLKTGITASKLVRTAEVTVKKDRNEWMKVDLRLPTSFDAYRRQETYNEVFKAALTWDISTGPKELSAEYKMRKESRVFNHELITKVKINDVNYKMDLDIKASDYHTYNMTVFNNDKRLMDASVGFFVRRSGRFFPIPKNTAFDWVLKTHRPMMKERHYIGLFTTAITSSPKRTASVRGHLVNVIDNQKIGIDVSLEELEASSRSDSWKSVVALTVNREVYKVQNQVSVVDDKTYELVGHYEHGLPSVRTDYHLGLETTPNQIFRIKLNTPSAHLSDLNVRVELTDALTVTVTWNGDKEVKAEFKCSNHARKCDFTLHTPMEYLHTMAGGFEKDAHVYREYLNWDGVNMLENSFEFGGGGKPTFRFVNVIKVPSYRMDMKSELYFNNREGNQAGVMKAFAQYDSGNTRYKLDLQMNTITSEGRLHLEGPFEKFTSAEMNIHKLGERDYRITFLKNGQPYATGRAVDTIDRQADRRNIKVDVTDVTTPWSFEYEHVGGKSLKLVYIPNLENRNEVYLSSMERSLQYSGHKHDGLASYSSARIIRLQQPKRKMMLKFVDSLDSRDGKYTVSVEFQPNENRQTRVAVEVVPLSTGSVNIGGGFVLANFRLTATLTDPNLKHPVELVIKLEGSDNLEEKPLTLESRLSYSNDKKRDFYSLIKAEAVFENGDRSRPIFKFSKVTQHPISGIDMKTYLNFLIGKGACSGDCHEFMEIGVQFKEDPDNTQKQDREIKFRAETNRQTWAKFELNTGSDVWVIEDRRQSNTFHSTVSKNGKLLYSYTESIDTVKKVIKLEVKDHTTETVLLHISLQMTDKDTIQFRLWHSEKGRRVNDAEITLRLTEPDLLRTSIYWRPGFTREIKYMVQQQWKHYYNYKIGRSMRSKRELPMDVVREDFLTEIEPMLHAWERESSQIVADWRPVAADMGDTVDSFSNAIGYLLSEYVSAFEGLVHYVYRETRTYMRSINLEGLQLIDMRALDNMMSYFVDFWSSVFTNIGEMVSKVAQFTGDTFKSLARSTKQMVRSIKANPIVRKMKSLYKEAMDMIPTISWETLSESLDYYEKAAMDTYNYWTGSTRKHWDQLYRDLMSNEFTRAMVETVEDALSTAEWSWNYMEPKSKMQLFFGELRKLIADPTDITGRTTVIENSPETGRYITETRLPLRLHSLEGIPKQLRNFDVSSMREFENGDSMWNEILSPHKAKSWSNMLDRVEKHKNRFLPAIDLDVITSNPHFGSAMLVGDHHIVTFDHHVYDFAGDCTYLLVHDMKDELFSVTVEYSSDGKQMVRKGLDIHLDGDLVHIGRDGELIVNGEKSETPFVKMDDNTHPPTAYYDIKRDEHAITLDSLSVGLKVSCNLIYDVCTVGLKRHNYGKSAGMLGTNDNEPNNDMILPDRSNVRDVGKFAAEWNVKPDCRSQRNHAPAMIKQEIKSIPTKCREMFTSSSSPLSRCFTLVKPGAYMQMCADDVKNGQKMCTAMVAYVMECNADGREIDIPDDCVKCDDLDKKSRGSVSELTRNAADVVFLVDSNIDVDRLNEDIQRMAQNIKRDMTNKGMEDVRFGVVAFNRDVNPFYMKPHFYTGNGKLLMRTRDVQKAASSMKFNSPGGSRYNERFPLVSPLDATWHTVKEFPFRAGSEKVIALMSSTSCKGQMIGHYDLQMKLLEHGVKLNFLTQDKIKTTKKDASRGKDIHGFDSGSVYFHDNTEDRALRRFVIGPSDSCSTLAQETGGSVFKMSAKTQFAKHVAKSADVGVCQKCECRFSRDDAAHLGPKSVCFPCKPPHAHTFY
jgi:hypothetical protein